MGQPWLEDEIYEWPVRRFLNRIAFVKDKNEMEQQIRLIENQKAAWR